LHILDDIEDGDAPGEFGRHRDASQMLNASTGLLLSGSLLLQDLGRRGFSDALIGELTDDLHRSILRMCGGQHSDLTQTEASLEAAWRIAELKTGAFFALACRMGARLATDDPERLGAFSEYGHHLGILIQIGDDWGDLWPQAGQSDLARGSAVTLPVAYALDVLSQGERDRLRAALKAAQASPDAEAEALGLIEGAGAELYLATQAVLHQQRAGAALERACPPSGARDELAVLLDRISVSRRC
jgi:geranylgeranyl pyrophosphate synthase